MKFGIKEKSYKLIIKIISEFSEIEKAYIFGSRISGNFKRGSDIDIALIGKDVTFDIICKLSTVLNEKYPLPYYFDILDYNDIDNIDLKNHINKKGKVLFKK